MFTFRHNEGRMPLSIAWLTCRVLMSSKGHRSVVSSYITIPSEKMSTCNDTKTHVLVKCANKKLTNYHDGVHNIYVMCFCITMGDHNYNKQ